MLAHNGEGARSREAFEDLSPGARDEVIEFLKSLQVLRRRDPLTGGGRTRPAAALIPGQSRLGGSKQESREEPSLFTASERMTPLRMLSGVGAWQD